MEMRGSFEVWINEDADLRWNVGFWDVCIEAVKITTFLIVIQWNAAGKTHFANRDDDRSLYRPQRSGLLPRHIR